MERNGRRGVACRSVDGYLGCNLFCKTATSFPPVTDCFPCTSVIWEALITFKTAKCFCALFPFRFSAPRSPRITGGLNPFTSFCGFFFVYFLKQAEVTKEQVCTVHSAFLCSTVPLPDSHGYPQRGCSVTFGFSSFTEGVHSVLQNLVQHVS